MVGLIIALQLGMMGLGIVNFPDAPLRLQGDGSVGKFGAVHSREDYRRFKLWERTFLGTGGVFAATAIVGLAVNLGRRSRQTRSEQKSRTLDT